jgi:hypothetical protein
MREPKNCVMRASAIGQQATKFYFKSPETKHLIHKWFSAGLFAR